MSERDGEGVRLAALVEVRRAMVADRAAREDAEARERLRQAALDAVDAGATATEVARLAGVTRVTIYLWRDGREQAESGEVL